ncbi:hypothetical protein SKDZ_04G3280 [Saccharomyces kudriavzevii ZP591]|uniref:Arp10p n=1 Tax=Saccharomyces cerevisiae x Saccharomyces kudriavzevii (strain VIN7) TaxID=1095631 RepID=H0GSQ6_SACCK|nr:Arp10p [Saccharomyces cerevisiae x Saccharomyces kudriavzevii VIN7]CAI4058147.1 hypothetical protein SKDZ_04G3280 [Saccharomyces kudriavzevii ZP591]
MPDSIVIVYWEGSKIEIGRSDRACPQETIPWKTGTIDEENSDELKEIFNHYFQMYGPLENQEVHVLILEDVFTSIIEKRIICGILLLELKCACVSFIPRVIMHCISCNATNALVIDVSAAHTTCVPIFDLRPLQKSIRYSKRGKSQLVLDDYPSGCPYTPVFFDEDYNSKIQDDDEIPVINLAKCIINSLPIDLRKPLRENIILVNVEEEYEATIRDLFKQKMDMSKIQLSKNCWRGGSIYAKTLLHAEGVNVVGVKREEFYNDPNIAPDWFDFYFRSGAKCTK